MFVLILALCAVACGQLQRYGQWTTRPGFTTETMFFKGNDPVIFERNNSHVFLYNHTNPLDAPISSLGYPMSGDMILICGNANLRSSPFYRLNYVNNTRYPNYPYTAKQLTTYVSPDEKYMIATLGYNSTDGAGLFSVELFTMEGNEIVPQFKFPSTCPDSYIFRKKYSIATETFLCDDLNVVTFYHVNISAKNVTLFQTIEMAAPLDIGSATLSKDGQVFAAVLSGPYPTVNIYTLQGGTFINVQNVSTFSTATLRQWVEMTADGSDIFVGVKDTSNGVTGVAWFHRFLTTWDLYQVATPPTTTINMIDMALSQDETFLLFRTLNEVIRFRILYPTDPTTTSPSSSSHDLSILLPSTSPASFASQSSSSGAQQASESSLPFWGLHVLG